MTRFATAAWMVMFFAVLTGITRSPRKILAAKASAMWYRLKRFCSPPATCRVTWNPAGASRFAIANSWRFQLRKLVLISRNVVFESAALRSARDRGPALGRHEGHASILLSEQVPVDGFGHHLLFVLVERAALLPQVLRELHQDQTALRDVLPVLTFKIGRQFMVFPQLGLRNRPPTLGHHFIEVVPVLFVP